ncbi:MAG: DUF1919 domain-containing protein [Eubacteriales bacterium]|nr:DUF1919 domain-containing protein [Eubacteriales bacterium]
MLSSAHKRFIKEAILELPMIKNKKKEYIDRMRSEYNYDNPTPSIICSTCIGGMIYNNLGLKFMSPTINLWITPSDFTKICSDMEKYINTELCFIDDDEYDFPVGKLDDVIIYFQHYHTKKEAYDKWEERKKRIDFDNLYIITDDKDLTAKEIETLINSRYKRLVIFTNKKNKEEPFFSYKCYAWRRKVGKYSVRSLTGFAPFEKEFNYALWLSGGNI